LVSEHQVTDGDQSVRLELYKLSVEMADRISARRAAANGFFFTVHAVLIAAIGLVHTEPEVVTGNAAAGAGGAADDFGLVFTSILGVLLSATWWLLLKSYRDLNSAKFSVINEIEKSFPVQPFASEWAFLKNDPKPFRKRYAELGVIERVVPLLFGVLYIAAIVRWS
jgi:hypothetical protein